MKMVMVTYNEALDNDVMDALKQSDLKNYTKLINVFGKGILSGPHFGNDIWPGKNNILYVVCDDLCAGNLMNIVKRLRESLGAEGLKAFMIPVDEVT